MNTKGKFLLIILSFSIISYSLIGAPSAYSQEVREVNPPLLLDINKDTFDIGDTILISGTARDYDSSSDTLSGDIGVLIIHQSNIVDIAQIKPKANGDFTQTFVTGPNGIIKKAGEYTITAKWNYNVATVTFELTGVTGSNVSSPSTQPTQPTQPDTETPPVESTTDDEPEFILDEEPVMEESKSGGGCLIATATFGSEMAPQVQFLREIRDNTVLQTESGTSFMAGFNQFYYSFSPVIADYERENPVFKEAVKLTLTPLLTSLTLLQYADIDSESEMLGYGIGVILLNIGMYFVAPAVLIMKIRTSYNKIPKNI